MSNLYIFADEAGCFTFNRNDNVSKYFILCTITTPSIYVGHALHGLRQDLVHEGVDIGDYFHATKDSQSVRDRVYDVILQHDFQIQATICEKAKAIHAIRVSKSRFYKTTWFFHFNHEISKSIKDQTKILVTAASIGTKKERASFIGSLDDVMKQTIDKHNWAVDFRPSQCDPCLQVADYCAWAIQRKWERNDTRSYDLVSDRITREYDLWSHGKTLHY